ncbi:MAG: hypothetical protein C0619_10930 [Desulfuromonas sp.]|nr:MAG: hypothetical protein C0619_10930 [Desulfuromonas sp.]
MCNKAEAQILFGLGNLENVYDERWQIHAVPAEHNMDGEPKLLGLARPMMPQILIDRYDVLVVDEAGKNIVGTGMDQ